MAQGRSERLGSERSDSRVPEDEAGTGTPDDLIMLRPASAFHGPAVYRRGDVLIKAADPWTPTVHALLRHLEHVGFEGAPRVVGNGFDDAGRQTLTFIEGDFIDPGPWSLEASHEVGTMLRRLHEATSSFEPPEAALWRPWFGRDLCSGVMERDKHGRSPSTESGGPVFGHCDPASWNIVARDGLPQALIDWEYAGPVDPLVELAQACWLNAKLHGERVAELEGLPPVAERAKQLRAIVDGYRLPAAQRRDFVDRIIGFAIHATANEADEAGVDVDTPTEGLASQVPWALAWRARAAAWMLRHRATLQAALR